jgi:hypothetical protein
MGGATSRDAVKIQDGRLKLTPVGHNEAGQPLEWIEVQIA